MTTTNADWFKRPMLAAKADADDMVNLHYPLLGSPKLDGIRCIIHPTRGPVTRSFKVVPNLHIQKLLGHEDLIGLDGEIMLIGRTNAQDFNSIQSAVMSRSGEPDITFLTFDYVPMHSIAGLPYHTRLDLMRQTLKDVDLPYVRQVVQNELSDHEEVMRYAHKMISIGYEGIVLRHMYGEYKFGRSTLKQQGMVKYKEFSDAEGRIIGFEELMHNENILEEDEFGLAKRSSQKDGMIAGGTLGALIISTEWGELRLGSGFDMDLRDKIWNNRSYFLGKEVTFKYQTFGMQNLPRFPIFLRFRGNE